MKRFYLSIVVIIFFASCKTSEVTPYEYALLSAHVYNDGTKTLPQKFQTFQSYKEKEKSFTTQLGSFLGSLDFGKMIDMTQNDNDGALVKYLTMKAVSMGGYYGQAYYDTKSNQLIIAHRGTDNLISAFTEGQKVDDKIGERLWELVKDLDDDYEIYNGKIPRMQYREAWAFTKKIKRAYEKQFGESPKVVHTGHSLGAVLAELCAITEDSRAVTFESPGTAPLMQELEEVSNGDFDYEKFKPEQAKITTYNAEPNRINTLHKHLGKVIPLYKGNKNQAMTKGNLFENIQQHSIDSLLVRFDTKTGKPKLD